MDFNPSAMPVRHAIGEIRIDVCLNHSVEYLLVFA
jgi:hypothetical protein